MTAQQPLATDGGRRNDEPPRLKRHVRGTHTYVISICFWTYE